MNQNYLEELINEVRSRGGGLILNVNNVPSAVVLDLNKYNQIMSNMSQTTLEQKNLKSPAFTPQTILVTGGAGYIGSHIASELVKLGHKVLVLDNLSTGKAENLPVLAKLIEGDCGDINLLRDIFASENINLVMHLAASIEVEESILLPGKYLANNAINTQRLLTAMDEANVRQIIFSSTAAVYGEPTEQPIKETTVLKPNNPYGFSKMVAEKIIQYYCEFNGFNAVVFRYFNACGTDFEGKIKATHESHLLAKIMNVVAGKDECLVINGNDYQTKDGTCVRDFVHVLDIASAHILGLQNIEKLSGFNVYNIGTGKGFSVLEIVNAAAEILNKMIPMQIGSKRSGDAALTIADNTKIALELGFQPQFSSLETIIKTAYKQI